MKRRVKADGTAGLQGEFGIGLLSFWTVGDELTMTSTGTDQRAYQMVMRKGDPSFSVSSKRTLFGDGGTEVRIAPLLDGIRALSGEKIQWYLAAELRDRIRATGVRINVVDKIARKQYAVEPRQYEGRLLHQLPLLRTPLGDIYVELFLNEPADTNCVALYRRGTGRTHRVAHDASRLAIRSARHRRNAARPSRHGRRGETNRAAWIHSCRFHAGQDRSAVFQMGLEN